MTHEHTVLLFHVIQLALTTTIYKAINRLQRVNNSVAKLLYKYKHQTTVLSNRYCLLSIQNVEIYNIQKLLI